LNNRDRPLLQTLQPAAEFRDLRQERLDQFGLGWLLGFHVH